jgi:hypothetical protein
MMIYHLYIELEGTSPLVWRRLVIPADYTLFRLHMALQGAFGWENSHLFEFIDPQAHGKVRYGIPSPEEPDEGLVDARKMKLNNYLRVAGQACRYIYDFGDYWKHKVTLEKSEAGQLAGPHCTSGSGACPPEDVGGLPGYYEMVEAAKKPSGKKWQEYRQWLGLVEGENWDAAFCSIREVNKRLCLLG